MKKLILIMLFFTAGLLQAQEICNNGIDDDGDLLIDLNDPDCACSGTGGTTPSSLIPNPSFEDFSCCPTECSGCGGPDYLTDCADIWIQASIPTSDYMNTCSFTGDAPQPFPDGNAGAGFICMPGWMEYIGACLTSPMIAGTQYTIQFDLAFQYTDGWISSSLPGQIPTCPIDITIFGTPNCSDIPWSGYECPIGYGGFVVLGSVSYQPVWATWGVQTITFTPTFDVYAVAIGGPCTLPTNCGFDNVGYAVCPYFYIDNLLLNESTLFNPVSITSTGHLCTDDLILTCVGGSTGTYQWYYNGIAIAGQTGVSIDASAAGYGPGTYNVMYTDVNGCAIADIVVTLPVVTANAGSDQTICNGETASLSASGGTLYEWNQSLGTGQNQTVSPGNTTTYIVTVSDANGCSDTDDITINVISNPTPSITGVLAFCIGSSTILDAGGGFTGYLWNTNDVTQTLTVTSTGNYSVVVTDANGCTGTDNVNVTTNVNLNADAGPDETICEGTSTVISASGGITFDWDNGLGNGQSHSVSPAATTTYNVTVTDANGCSGTDNTTVFVEQNPVITITPAAPVTCQGSDVMITASGATTYTWSPSGGLSSASGSVVYASPETPTTYTVTGTTAAGCTSTGNVTVDVTEVVISASIDQYICSGSSTDLYVSVIGGTPPYSYTWNGMPGPETITVSPTVNTTIAVIATDATGCISNTDYVNISVTKPLQFSVAVNETDVCPGEQVVITGIWSEGMPPYVFTDENGALVTFPYMVYPAEAASYVIYITDACGTELQDNVSVNTYPVPLISMSADTLQGCQPFTVHFNESNNYSSYFWEFGNDPDNLSHNHNPVHTFDYPGVYDISLTVTNEFGCISSQTINDLIKVYPAPVANFTPDPEIVSILKPEITFINHTIDGYFYYWSFGDGDSSWYVNPTHRFNDLGEYNVVLIAESEHGCRDTVFDYISVKDEYTFYAPTAFSPDADGTNDLFRVYGHGIDMNSFKMIIYDRWGEPIFETNNMEGSWNGRMAGSNKVVKSGSYPWICIFKDFKGIEHEETGAVTVIR